MIINCQNLRWRFKHQRIKSLMSLISPQFPPGFVHYPEFFNQEEQQAA